MNPATNPLDESLRNLTPCGCGTGISAQTPQPHENRAGLSAISFRAGTHGHFKSSLLAALTGSGRPALGRLTTREDEDFTIALLDGFSAMADVLTFYNERIAQESWLRTATERRSIMELARGIGYELTPGVAAETRAAFTVEDAPGAPGWAEVPAGTKLQSIPGPGEEPQTYETMEAFTAKKEWNVLRAKRFRTPGLFHRKLWLKGGSLNVQKGDFIFVTGTERAASRTSERWDVRCVVDITKENESDPQNTWTILHLEYGLGSSMPLVNPAESGAEVYVFRQRANLFGWNAADWGLIANEVRKHYLPRLGNEPDNNVGNAAWTERVSKETDWPDFTISGVEGSAVPALEGGYSLHLDSVQDSFVPGTWLALLRPGSGSNVIGHRELYSITGNSTGAKSGFGLTAKVSRLLLNGENLLEEFDDHLRETLVLGKSERLDDARTEISGGVTGDTITLDTAVEGLEPGRLLIVTGTDEAGAEHVEHVTLKAAAPDPEDSAVTMLELEEPLQFSYTRSSVRVYANTARVTHGETVAGEIPGSGNAGLEHQKFALKQKPLTYTQSAEGAASSLTVNVNGVQWQEVESLYEQSPGARVFVVRLDNDGTARVIFGDGWFGSRVPTGTENIAATYRKGTGLAGLVRSGQLTQLLNRPLGIRSAFNPAASSGAADPETMEEARRNAPLQTLTLGRVVSMADFAAFARAFPGVAKAHAVWVWTPRGRGVLVHVAGPDEAVFTAADALPGNLRAALVRKGDPLVPVLVRSGTITRFGLAGVITADAGRLPEDVKAQVDAALTAAFSYEAREFGAAVYLSELLEVIHSVPGVLLTALTAFQTTTTTGVPELLMAAAPQPGADAAQAPAAEVLLLDPASLVQLTVISAS